MGGGGGWGGVAKAKPQEPYGRGQIWATKKATVDKLGGPATHDCQK